LSARSLRKRVRYMLSTSGSEVHDTPRTRVRYWATEFSVWATLAPVPA
jgi:hypothetical protein